MPNPYLIQQTLKDELKNELFGSLASMRCFQIYMQSDGEGAARVARRALELLSRDDLAERGFTMIILAVALQMTGDVKGAKSAVYSAMTDRSARGDNGATFMTRLLNGLCFVHWIDADLKGLSLAAKDSADLGMQANLWEVLSGSLHFKAAVHYHRNELSAVEGDLQVLLQRKAIANLEFHAQSLIISALTHGALENS